MESKLLETVGQIAGIGGLALAVFILISHKIISKNIFPMLKSTQAHRLLRLLIILAWTVAIGGLITYLAAKYMDSGSKKASNPSVEIAALVPSLSHKDYQVRVQAIEGIAALGTRHSVSPLIHALSDNDLNVRSASLAGIAGILNTDQNYDEIVLVLRTMPYAKRKKTIDRLMEIKNDRLNTRIAELAKPLRLTQAQWTLLGIEEARRLVKVDPNIDVAIIGGGINKTYPGFDSDQILERNYIESVDRKGSGKPCQTTTLAALLIAGIENSPITGIVPGARLKSKRVVDAGEYSVSSLAPGIFHTIKEKPKVICFTFNGPQPRLNMNLDNIDKHSGSVVVVPAGSENSLYQNFPTIIKGVISVAGTDGSDKKLEDSNYGSWVAISAPGQCLNETQFKELGITPLSGSILSAALVAGAAALVWSVDPSMTNEQVKDILISSSDNIDDINPQYRKKLGSGRLNVLQAVKKALELKARSANVN